jgi:AraC-like DNA-binding protein
VSSTFRDEIIIQTPSVGLGVFRLPPHGHRWRATNRIAGGHLIAMPRVAVHIHQDQNPAVLANPNHVMFYNAKQEYERRAVHPRGDESEYFVVAEDVLRELIAEFDPSVVERPGQPFRFGFGPSDPRIYLFQRRLYRAVVNGAVEPLWFEEQGIRLVREALRLAHDARRAAARRRSAMRQDTVVARRAVVSRAIEYLATHFREQVGLAAVARAAFSSRFHLCRVFREETGMSLHQFVVRLRLFEGLDDVLSGEQALTKVALDLGFSSHSHMAASYRQAFGAPPTRLRRECIRAQI